MSEENNNNTSFVMCLLIIVLGVVIVSIGGCAMVEQTKQKAIEKGLVQKWDSDARDVIWTTPEPAK